MQAVYGVRELSSEIRAVGRHLVVSGGVAERLKALVLKTSEDESPP